MVPGSVSAAIGSVVMGGPVLVVDDDEAMLDSTLALLTSQGYEAVGANSGLTALALLRDGVHPRLVLLDLHMPGMDGWKFRAELLCDPDLAPIPVVVVSAAGGPAVRAAVEAMRAAAALVKPVDADELLRVVAALTG
jgi:CheY-like chemotaxis protein